MDINIPSGNLISRELIFADFVDCSKKLISRELIFADLSEKLISRNLFLRVWSKKGQIL